MSNFGLSPKPVSQQLYDRLNSQNSLAPVYFPGEAMPSSEPVAVTDGVEEPATQSEQPEASASSWLDIVARVSAIPADTAADKKKRDQFSTELATLLAEIETFEKRILGAARVRFTDEHKKLRKECRAQLQLVARLRNAAINAEAGLRNAIEERRFTMNELHAATHAPLPRYATDTEIAEKNAAIEKARAAAKRAEQAEGAAMNSRHGAGQQLNEALEKMAALEREEVRLRHALDGTSYVDPELGLVVK